MIKTIIPITLTAALFVGSANAAITITNGDMETNGLAGSGDFTSGVPPTGWVGNTGITNTIGDTRTEVADDPNGIAWAHLQNKGAAELSAMGNSIGDITSNLGTTVNVTYTVSRRMNEGGASTAVNHSLMLYAGSSSTWVGGTLLDTLSLTPTVDTTVGDSDAAAFYLGDSNLDMPTSYGGSEDTLWFVFRNDLAIHATNNSQVLFDDVAVSAVPEPSSAALIGLGGLALILRRRK